jgi:hypothetical protein
VLRKVAILLVVLVMVLTMLVVSAPMFAQGVGGSDPQPGQTEKARSGQSTPPQGKPGGIKRSPTANEHETSDSRTGFGRRVEEQQG